MARLIFIEEFTKTLNPSFYFSNCYYRDGNYVFKIEDNYPEHEYIHQDTFEYDESNGLCIAIRKFIERFLDGDVIINLKNMSYWSYESNRSERHGYYRFSFETVSDRVLFALNFKQYLMEPSTTRPSYHEIPRFA